jgi:hypothetical protein
MAKQTLYLSYIRYNGEESIELTGICSCVKNSIQLNRDLHFEDVENRSADIEIYTAPINSTPTLDEIVFNTLDENDLESFLK